VLINAFNKDEKSCNGRPVTQTTSDVPVVNLSTNLVLKVLQRPEQSRSPYVFACKGGACLFATTEREPVIRDESVAVRQPYNAVH
jgi:hypothetical protein